MQRSAPLTPLGDLPAGWGDGYRGFGADVDHTGTADFTIHGDALISDIRDTASWLTVDRPALLPVHVQNAPGATTEFVDRVAG